jgi:hypothetical protein
MASTVALRREPIDFPSRPNLMSDAVYLALTAALFALTWGLVRLCDRV